MRFDTRFIGGGPTRDIPNLFDNLASVLQTPSAFHKSYSVPAWADDCDLMDKNRGITLFAVPNNGAMMVVGCNPGIGLVLRRDDRFQRQGLGGVGRAGHHNLERGDILTIPGWHENFDDLSTRRCYADSDCGGQAGALCVPSDDNRLGPWTRSRVGSAKICAGPASAASAGRAQGFVTDYALNNIGHNWIESAFFQRWFGEDFRAVAQADLANGDTRLWNKYQWLRTSKLQDSEQRRGTRHLRPTRAVDQARS